jgi:hypothetical protein
MFHAVYLSFEEKENGRMYIGKHSSENPYDVYFGSFYDKSFNPAGKIILEYCNTEQGAVEAEIRWQQVFKVAEDPQFANKSYQTSKKFLRDNRGEKHPLFGKKRPDVRERNQKNNPAKRLEVRQKMSKSRMGNTNGIGKLWWVNKDGKIIGNEECPGEGWQRGRTWKG